MRWVGEVARMNDTKCAYRISVWRPLRKRTLGRHKSRWEDSNKLDIQNVVRRTWNWLIWL